MNLVMSKVTRFLLNFVLYALILLAVTYHSYTNNPDFFTLKTLLAPFGEMLILAVILAIMLSGINEITTLGVSRFWSRR